MVLRRSLIRWPSHTPGLLFLWIFTSLFKPLILASPTLSFSLSVCSPGLISEKEDKRTVNRTVSFCITLRFTYFSTCSSLFLSASSQEIAMLCNIILSKELCSSSPTAVWINYTLWIIPTLSPSVFHKSPVPCSQPTKTNRQKIFTFQSPHFTITLSFCHISEVLWHRGNEKVLEADQNILLVTLLPVYLYFPLYHFTFPKTQFPDLQNGKYSYHSIASSAKPSRKSVTVFSSKSRRRLGETEISNGYLNNGYLGSQPPIFPWPKFLFSFLIL